MNITSIRRLAMLMMLAASLSMAGGCASTFDEPSDRIFDPKWLEFWQLDQPKHFTAEHVEGGIMP